MKSLWTLFGLLIGSLSLGTSAVAVEEDPLRTDSRLDRPIALKLTDQPLRKVLTKVASQVPVPLSVSADVADDNVSLLVTSGAAGEVLSLLAENLNLRWRRAARGYTLGQEGAERRKEEARFRQDLERDWKEVSDWTDRLIRLSRTPLPERTRRLADLDKRLAAPDLQADERSRLTELAASLRDSLRPSTGTAAAVLDSLSLEQVRKLMQRGNLLLSEKNGSLNPLVAAAVRQTPSKDAATPDQDEYPIYADAQVEIIEGARPQGPPKPEDRAYRLMVELIARSEEGWRPVQWSPELPPLVRPPLAATATHDPVLLRSVSLQLKRFRSPQTKPQRGDSVSAYNADRHLWPDWPTLGDFARAVHEVSGLPVIADGFIRARVDPNLPVFKNPRPLVEVLDSVCHELSYTWRKEGGVLLLRTKTAYRDRLMQIPERLLDPWRKRVTDQGEVRLDDLAELAAALEDHRALGMAYYWGWYLEDAWAAPPNGSALTFYRSRRHLRFWASMTGGQRHAVLAGEVLPVKDMSPTQRQVFLTALLDPSASPWTPGAELLLSDHAPSAEEVQTGA